MLLPTQSMVHMSSALRCAKAKSAYDMVNRREQVVWFRLWSFHSGKKTKQKRTTTYRGELNVARPGVFRVVLFTLWPVPAWNPPASPHLILIIRCKASCGPDLDSRLTGARFATVIVSLQTRRCRVHRHDDWYLKPCKEQFYIIAYLSPGSLVYRDLHESSVMVAAW